MSVLRHASSEQDIDTPESAGLWGADWGSALITALKAKCALLSSIGRCFQVR